MTQRHITINAYTLHDFGPTGFTVGMDLTGKSPSKRVGIQTVADCKAALSAFAAELKPLGKPLHLSVLFDKKSGRKPAGFDKADSARELQCHVNAHLAPPRSP